MSCCSSLHCSRVVYTSESQGSSTTSEFVAGLPPLAVPPLPSLSPPSPIPYLSGWVVALLQLLNRGLSDLSTSPLLFSVSTVRPPIRFLPPAILHIGRSPLLSPKDSRANSTCFNHERHRDPNSVLGGRETRCQRCQSSRATSTPKRTKQS